MARQRIGNESEDRTIVIGFKVTPHEKAMLENRAKADGETLSEFIRVSVYGELLLRGDREAFKVAGRAMLAKLRDRFVEQGLMGPGEKLSV